MISPSLLPKAVNRKKNRQMEKIKSRVKRVKELHPKSRLNHFKLGLRYGHGPGWTRFCLTGWLGLLGLSWGHCFGFRLDPFHLESHHAKFQLNPLRNGWDIGFYCLKILQCCRIPLLLLTLFARSYRTISDYLDLSLAIPSYPWISLSIQRCS